MRQKSNVRVLVVEDDMDQHQVIHDIIEINLKDAIIDRVMNPEMVLPKLRKSSPSYNLILFDLSFHQAIGSEVLAAIRAELPALVPHLVVLVGSIQEFEGAASAQGLPYILKPFSLDSFSDIIEKVCQNT